jgi:hypothetical protein
MIHDLRAFQEDELKIGTILLKLEHVNHRHVQADNYARWIFRCVCLINDVCCFRGVIRLILLRPYTLL